MSPAEIQQHLHAAASAHNARRFAEAESIYRRILAVQPQNADALHLLGVLAGQCGHPAEAVRLIRQAIQISPHVADYHCNLASFLLANGQVDDAIASFQSALVLGQFQAGHVSSHRISFVGMQPRGDYLRTYARIDIGLDTFPYGGHSTSFDALWMGVPLVTLVGRTVVGRAGVSQLSNIELTELVARTPREYVRIAAELAADLPRLAEIRRTMRDRMRNSPLTDGQRFVLGVERAYRNMWMAWCVGSC
jgi:predicted O-linked N-acetylglucosamine transferase (SPINDLY family)